MPRPTFSPGGWHGGGFVQGVDYYRFLARTLPAGELGGAVLRRLRRATVRTAAALLPDTTPDIPAALHLRSPNDFAERMRTDRAARGPIEPNERFEARRQLAALLPEHAGVICALADRVLAGELFLFGEWRDHSRGELAPGIAAIDWLRDPLHDAHAPDGPSRTINVVTPGLDARAVWEAARFAHVYWLAQAHVVAGLRGTEVSRGVSEPGLYVRAMALHIRDFIATQPVGQGIHWTGAMEAALRVIHLVLALSLVRDAPELDGLFWSEVAQSLLQHGRFITRDLEDAQTVPGNHLLSDYAGLAVLGCLFPELPDAMKWRQWALPAFARELLRQTTPDGLSFEASLPYHRFVTELGLLVQAAARRQGLGLGAPALGRLWKMCDVVDGATLTDGRLANIGDNDATRAFSVVIRSPLETSHITALKAALGGPAVPATIEPEALWIGGLVGLRHNVQLMAPKLAEHCHSRGRFSAEGLTVLRGLGGRSATLWAGSNGQHGLGGHAHNDKLASEIVLNGCRIAVDPGCPTYAADPSERDHYRSTAAHPTVQVDQEEQGPIPKGQLFFLPEAAHACVVKIAGHEAWAEHRGYTRLVPPVLHRREISIPDVANAICVTDWLLGEGSHVVDLRWPLTTGAVTITSLRGNARALLYRLGQLTSGEGRFDPDRAFVIEAGPTQAVLAIACEQPWEAAIAESTWSPGYGERVPGATVQIRARGQCPMTLTSLFVTLDTAAEGERK